MKKIVQVASVGACLALLLALLAACSPSPSQSGGTTTLTVATVNNSQMVQMEQLTQQVFEKQYPTIKVKFVTLPENDLRTKVTQDVATNALYAAILRREQFPHVQQANLRTAPSDHATSSYMEPDRSVCSAAE